MQQFIYLLILAALMTGCAGSDNTKDAAGSSHDATFYQAMGVADSLYNCMQFRDAYKLYWQLLDSKEADDDSEKRLSVLNALSSTSELSGHKDEQHKWLQQLLDLAMQTDNDYYQSLAHITMGQNIFYEGHHEKGIYSVKKAIDLMAKTDRENADHLMHGYLNLLASMYSEMKDYDNALKTNERNLQLTMDGTRWGATPNQQLIDRRMALAKMASVLAEMGHAEEPQGQAYGPRAGRCLSRKGAGADHHAPAGQGQPRQPHCPRHRHSHPVVPRFCRHSLLQEQDYQSQESHPGPADYRRLEIQGPVLERETDQGTEIGCHRSRHIQ